MAKYTFENPNDDPEVKAIQQAMEGPARELRDKEAELGELIAFESREQHVAKHKAAVDAYLESGTLADPSRAGGSPHVQRLRAEIAVIKDAVAVMGRELEAARNRAAARIRADNLPRARTLWRPAYRKLAEAARALNEQRQFVQDFHGAVGISGYAALSMPRLNDGDAANTLQDLLSEGVLDGFVAASEVEAGGLSSRD